MVSTLIKHNCSIHQPCVKRWSAMHEAAKQGRKDIVALLLKNGGNVNLKDGYGVTPLGVAAEYGHCDVLEHLIHKGMCEVKGKYASAWLPRWFRVQKERKSGNE